MKKISLALACSAFLLLGACGSSESGSSVQPSSEIVISSSSMAESASSSQQDDGKYALKDLDKLLANVAGANALGIRTSSTKSTLALRKNAAKIQKNNLWVKSSTFYDSSDPVANEDGTINVTFSKTVVNSSADEVTVTKTIRPIKKANKLNVLKEDASGIYFEYTGEKREYCVLSGSKVLLDWSTGTIENLTIGEGEDEKTIRVIHLACDATEQHVIQSRRTDVSYTFRALEGDKYSLKRGDTVLFSDVVDGSEGDANSKEGYITFSGLTEDVNYTFTQVGIRYTETVEQTDVNGVVDKLYTIGRYSFISFVPGDLQQRPSSESLKYNSFGISNYDETDYYSDSTRQSFVIDNEIGLVFKIENHHISRIENNLIHFSGDNYIYDMKVNEQNQLVFYALFSNSEINVYNVFEDRYGHSFIQNDKINTYDEKNDVTYYVFGKGNSASIKKKNYFITSNKETLAVEFDGWATVKDAYLIDENGERREITNEDSFDVLFDFKTQSCLDPFQSAIPYRVKLGNVYFFEGYHAYYSEYDPKSGDSKIDFSKSTFAFPGNNLLMLFNPAEKQNWNVRFSCETNTGFFLNVRFLSSNDILLFYYDSKLYALYDASDRIPDLPFGQAMGYPLGYPIRDGIDVAGFLSEPSLKLDLILDDCDIDSETGKVMKFGLTGNTYYDYLLVEKDGKQVVDAFEEGTKTQEIKTVVLQPIA